MTTKPVRKHYDWSRAKITHCGCGKWALTVIFDCEPTCAACIDAHYTSVLENHIDSQAARIAEQQAVIDQRNGECDRLINELAALREQDARKIFQCSACGCEGLDEPPESQCHCCGDGAHWIEGQLFPASNQQSRAVAVPERMEPGRVREVLDPTANPDEYACCVGSDMWNLCVAEMMRLNSGSKSDD